MKFDEYYREKGKRGADFALGFGITCFALILVFILASLFKFNASVPGIIGISILILAGIGQIIFAPRKLIGIGMVAPFALALIVFGSCLAMFRISGMSY